MLAARKPIEAVVTLIVCLSNEPKTPLLLLLLPERLRSPGIKLGDGDGARSLQPLGVEGLEVPPVGVISLHILLSSSGIRSMGIFKGLRNFSPSLRPGSVLQRGL